MLRHTAGRVAVRGAVAARPLAASRLARFETRRYAGKSAPGPQGSTPADDKAPAAEDSEKQQTTEMMQMKAVLAKSRMQLFEEVDRKVSQWEQMKGSAAAWWQHTKEHYVNGTKQLASNIRKSCAYSRKSLRGHTLSRRERRLMTRTLGDVFRVIPFSAFVLIPFMEFLLPVALKIFPNMLPSTYDDPTRLDQKYAKRLAAQVELTKLLQDTLEEMAVQIEKKSADAEMRGMATSFAEFLVSLKQSDKPLEMPYTELKRLLPLFNEDLGLSKMRRPQLIAMCKLLETPYFSLISEESLRIGLRMHLRRLKHDDILIEREGIESLSDKEVIHACKMRAVRVAPDADINDLRRELSNWILLSRQPGVSNSMLLFSRVLPLQHIRVMAEESARLYGERKVQKIEEEAELKSCEEEKEQYWKNVNAEWMKLHSDKAEASAAQAKDLSLEALRSTQPGTHLFMMSYGDVADMRRKEQALNTISEELNCLRETAEEIEELKEDSIEFKGEKEKKELASAAVNILERHIEKSITQLEGRLRSEEEDVVIECAKGVLDLDDKAAAALAAAQAQGEEEVEEAAAAADVAVDAVPQDVFATEADVAAAAAAAAAVPTAPPAAPSSSVDDAEVRASAQKKEVDISSI